MAYSVNGKVYTDHPLMDEIVHNCKLILQGIVIKNDILANDSESEKSVQDAEVFIMIKEDTVTFSVFPFTSEIYSAFGYSFQQINSFLLDKNNVPEEDRDKLLSFAISYFLEHFEETNNYYRMLNGLPPYNTKEYDIYIDDSYLPDNYSKNVDLSKPLHELDNVTIAILKKNGKMDEIRESHPGSNYSYICFLGESKIDLYKARIAKKWDILYIPPVEQLVEDKFKEFYSLNRDIYLKRTYQEAYAFNSTYYEECMIIMVLCQTFNDMIVDVPEWYIRRDIFDIRSVQYFLDSYGVKFFKEIPLKYQIRIVKNLNKLIKYKSSNKNNNDILEIFSLENTAIYKYYLYKKRLADVNGNYVVADTEDEMYDLEFVQCKLGDTYDNYIKDLIYRTPYDDITYQDKYWDGEDTHSYIKSLHVNRDFTIEGTKYMSVEYKISMSEYLLQMQYFLGLLLDSNVYMDDIKIMVPSVQPDYHFKLTDLFIFLYLITNSYNDIEAHIIKPTVEDGKKSKPEFEKYDEYDGGYSYSKSNEYEIEINDMSATENEKIWELGMDGGGNVEYSEIRSKDYFYDWMKDKYPELFIVNREHRVFGFNTKINLAELEEVINRRHSTYNFEHGFTLKELGVDKFIAPSYIGSIDELISIYNNNIECYNAIKQKIVEESNNRDEYITFRYVFDSLFTKEFDHGFYKLSDGSEAESLVDILKDRDFILYNLYINLDNESNLQTRQDDIRNIMNDIVNTLEYYLKDEGLEYIFSFATVTSFNSLIYYIYLMINFFKSYKVHFIDPYVTYTSDDRLENSVRPHDSLIEKRTNYWKEDKQFIRDVYSTNISSELLDIYRHAMIENIDIYDSFDPDPEDDYDYDGMYSSEYNSLAKQADAGATDDSAIIPFFVLDGKLPYENKDIFNVDGSGAMLDFFHFYDLDGGRDVPDDDYTKLKRINKFNYRIDGGSAKTNTLVTNSLRKKIIDKQLDPASVEFSTLTTNSIDDREDGIYLKEEYTAWSDIKDINTYGYNHCSSLYNILMDQIKYVDDDIEYEGELKKCEGLYETEERMIVDYTIDILESMKRYTNIQVERLVSEFNLYSPYEWEKFKE